MDLLPLFFYNVFSYPPYRINFALLFLLPFAIKREVVNSYRIFFILFFLCFSIIGYFIDNYSSDIFLSIHIGVMILIFMTINIKSFFEYREIRIFNVVWLFYFLSVLTKYLSLRIDIDFGIYLFYLVTVFQIFIGAFFIFRNTEDDSMIIKISK